ncbi:MAG: hypothetical protein WCI05_13505 [Myxococcales bacterium]|jgi:hypothetical protein
MTSLQSLELTRFKCFAFQRISLSAATVLTGLNGMGKSTVIQALLLLRQSARAGLLHPPQPASPWQRQGQSGLLLNGEFTRLGTAGDVLYEGAAEDSVGLAIRTSDDQGAAWRFSALPNADLLPWLDGPEVPTGIALFGPHFY